MLQDSPVYSYIPATDVGRARKFYEQTLGFKPKQEISGGVVYECAKGTAAFLYRTPNAGTSKASQLFWEVPDIEVEVAELKGRGVVFEKYDMPGTRRERNQHGRRRQGGVVQGFGGQHLGDHPDAVIRRAKSHA